MLNKIDDNIQGTIYDTLQQKSKTKSSYFSLVTWNCRISHNFSFPLSLVLTYGSVFRFWKTFQTCCGNSRKIVYYTIPLMVLEPSPWFRNQIRFTLDFTYLRVFILNICLLCVWDKLLVSLLDKNLETTSKSAPFYFIIITKVAVMRQITPNFN